MRVAVVGGGIAGLVAAYRLAQRGADVALYEAAERVGGVVGSVRTPEGFVFERGPHSVRSGAEAVWRLVRDLGLASRVTQAAPSARRRYIYRDGQLMALPSSPLALLKSPLLSTRGKLRLFSEPLWPARPAPGGDESLAALCRRRLGAEATEALVGPFVTGVYAGDVEGLGVDAFPTLRDAEREHGSFVGAGVAAALARRRRGPSLDAGRPTGIWSLTGGLQVLVDALSAALVGTIHVNAAIGGLDDPRLAQADAVVLATPGHVTARLLGEVPRAGFLGDIHYADVARVGLGFARRDVLHPLDGFGVLVAESSGLGADARGVLGVIFGSAVFSGRTPPDAVSMAVILGGVRTPEVATADPNAVMARAVAGVRAICGLAPGASPSASRVHRWAGAIPQLPPGHAGRVTALRTALALRSGRPIAICGNAIDGVSLDATAQSAQRAVDTVLDGLARR